MLNFQSVLCEMYSKFIQVFWEMLQLTSKSFETLFKNIALCHERGATPQPLSQNRSHKLDNQPKYTIISCNVSMTFLKKCWTISEYDNYFMFADSEGRINLFDVLKLTAKKSMRTFVAYITHIHSQPKIQRQLKIHIEPAIYTPYRICTNKNDNG